MAALFVDGVFLELGLSNFPAWQVMQVAYKCAARGIDGFRPAVYQVALMAHCRLDHPPPPPLSIPARELHYSTR